MNNPYRYPFYTNYPGQPQRGDDLTEEAQIAGLGPADGDLPFRRNKIPNGRWGQTVKLTVASPQKTATLVATPLFDTPIPIGYQLRFSADGVTYSSVMPANCGVDVALIKSLDARADVATERFGIDAGQSQPSCQVIARSLTITMKPAETALNDVYVEAVACPLTTLDCDAVMPGGGGNSFATARTLQFPAAILDAVSLPANPNRKYLLVVNHSTVDFHLFMSGSENPAIILPGSVEAGYDVNGYTGALTGEFQGDDATGYVDITEGPLP